MFDVDDSLPTALWVEAHIRNCTAQNIPVYVIQKGEGDRGTVMVKIVQSMQACQLLVQVRDMDGRLGWMNAFETVQVTEQEADQRITQERQYDPDLWVIEVESRDGQNPFDGGMV